MALILMPRDKMADTKKPFFNEQFKAYKTQMPTPINFD